MGFLTGERLYNDLALLKVISGKADKEKLSDVLADVKDKTLASKIKSGWDAVTGADIDGFAGKIDGLKHACDTMWADADQARKKGVRNTLKYLTWDYLDVYIATSMRHEWEFRETYTFVKQVLEVRLSNESGLALRWFDPTQSYDPNPIDKGLLEGLMLRRAECCIYMAQESDTLGKDSKLAATLAQGKPVIAYVREVTDRDLPIEVVQMKHRPFRYFRQRLTYLLSDGFFERPDARRDVSATLEQLGESLRETSYRKIVEDYLRLLYNFEDIRKFELISDEERHYREMHREHFERLEKFMAAVERVAVNNRARTIQSRHPLSMQVNLATGVANGVLVTRNYDACAQVVREILTKSLHFNITVEMNEEKTKKLGTALREEKTGSKFRIVTENKCLTNSFWNFYPGPERAQV